MLEQSQNIKGYLIFLDGALQHAVVDILIADQLHPLLVDPASIDDVIIIQLLPQVYLRLFLLLQHYDAVLSYRLDAELLLLFLFLPVPALALELRPEVAEPFQDPELLLDVLKLQGRRRIRDQKQLPEHLRLALAALRYLYLCALKDRDLLLLPL